MLGALVSADDPPPSLQRSALMSKVRHKNTSAELVVRKVSHSLGLRFRLHPRSLPGTPDLVFPHYRKAIFVHGCFWHRHIGCKRTTNPKTRESFWQAKFKDNIRRDRRTVAAIRLMGWDVLVVWECETKKDALLKRKLERFFFGRTRRVKKRSKT
jgi:DNA mismatch endonuclease (patch repair protein)